MIDDHEGPRVVQAWLAGLNPELKDRMPIRLLRDENVETMGRKSSGLGAFLAGGSRTSDTPARLIHWAARRTLGLHPTGHRQDLMERLATDLMILTPPTVSSTLPPNGWVAFLKRWRDCIPIPN
jgi:hypothetical protein